MAKAAPGGKPLISRVGQSVERSRLPAPVRDAGARRSPIERRTTGKSREGENRDLLGRTTAPNVSSDSVTSRQPEQLSRPVSTRTEVLLATGESGMNRGDTPRPLDARDVTQRVAEAIDSNPYLKHRPEQVREYLKQRIDALPYPDQLEAIQHIDELIKSSGFRRFLRRLDKGKKEEVAQRVEKITARLNEWRDQVLEHLQAAQKIPVEGGDHGSQLTRGPHEKIEAAREPTVADSRTDEERGHLTAAADKGLYDAAINMRQERVSRREKKVLHFLIWLEIALAAVHMTVPPER